MREILALSVNSVARTKVFRINATMTVTILISALALTCLYALASGRTPHGIDPAWLWSGVAGAILIMTFRQTLENIALRRLRLGLFKAREGLLDPVPTGRLGGLMAGRIIGEYNVTISTLQSMFRTVEECQGRLLNQRNKMSALLQSLPGALLSLSDDLQVIMANKQAEELFSSHQTPLIGANLFDVLRLGERDRELLRDTFLNKFPIRSQEISLDTDTGPSYYSLNLEFYNDEDNDIGCVLILQNISEYRQLQDSIAMREKLVAMGQLAAGVAHELNTPLGNILGYAQLLGRATENPEKLAEYARIIGDETKRCSRIVQDLLNYAREDRCTGETCEINQLIRELIETFLNCRLKRYDIEARLELAETPLVVEGGCGQLDIVLTNLILNAIHALDGVNNPVIVVSTRVDEDYAVIGVADNGLGVPVSIRNRIFDPFFTTKGIGQGSGLGLPISQAILGKRGGFIVYDSEYTEGARFLIKIPVVDMRRAGL